MWGDEDHIKKLKDAEEWPAPSEMPKGKNKLDAPDEMAKKAPRHVRHLMGDGLPSGPFVQPAGVPWTAVIRFLILLGAAVAAALLID